jgi:Flp pilus assembly protein TadG
MNLPSLPFAALTRLVARFHRDERGVFAVLFGIMAVVLIAMAGAVVDYAHVAQVQTRAQLALDSAALGLQKSIYTTPTPTSAATKTKAAAVVTERLADSTITVSVDTANIDVPNGSLELAGSVTVPTAFVRLIGFPNIVARIKSQAIRGSTQLEVAASLDITGSMDGDPLTSLQTATKTMITTLLGSSNASTTTRIALVPWSFSPNLGAYATGARGAVTGSTAITNVTWKSGTAKTITNISRANPAVVTSTGHGLSNGDVVYITGISGMTYSCGWSTCSLNSAYYTVGNVQTNTFTLSGINTTNYSSYSSGGTAQKCLTSSCELVVTSASHGLSNNSVVNITGVSGVSYTSGRSTYTANTVWSVASATTNTFALSGSTGPSYSAYSSGGNAWCTTYGCTYYYFTSDYGNNRLFTITNCASERTTNPYAETSPVTSPLSKLYRSDPTDCSDLPAILPLTNDSTTLSNTVDSFIASGSTAGHLGIAWAWYVLSPNFNSLWPTANQAAAYGTSGLQKIAIFMTDGDFNTPYCSGVIAADALSGSGSDNDHNSCNAPNGSSASQAATICTNMKLAGIKIYTIGFNVTTTNQTLLSTCSSGSDYDYFPTTTTELESVFTEIANSIQNLRVAK